MFCARKNNLYNINLFGESDAITIKRHYIRHNPNYAGGNIHSGMLFFSEYQSLGWIKRRETSPKEYVPQKKFALIVAAHNEEAVIGHIVDSLFRQNYPRNLFDVYVVADNCTDRTAEIAEEHGAIVYKRYNNSARERDMPWSGCLKKYIIWKKNMMQ